MGPLFSFGVMCGYDQMLCITFFLGSTKFMLFRMVWFTRWDNGWMIIGDEI